MSENVIQSLHKKSGFSIEQGLTGFDYKGLMVKTPCTFYLTLTFKQIKNPYQSDGCDMDIILEYKEITTVHLNNLYITPSLSDWFRGG